MGALFCIWGRTLWQKSRGWAWTLDEKDRRVVWLLLLLLLLLQSCVRACAPTMASTDTVAVAVTQLPGGGRREARGRDGPPGWCLARRRQQGSPGQGRRRRRLRVCVCVRPAACKVVCSRARAGSSCVMRVVKCEAPPRESSSRCELVRVYINVGRWGTTGLHGARADGACLGALARGGGGGEKARNQRSGCRVPERRVQCAMWCVRSRGRWWCSPYAHVAFVAGPRSACAVMTTMVVLVMVNFMNFNSSAVRGPLFFGAPERDLAPGES
jgi:hypothetical protein